MDKILTTTKTIRFDNRDILINADKIIAIFINKDENKIRFTFENNDYISIKCKSYKSAKEVVDKIEEFLHNENSNDNQIEYGISFGDI